LRKWAAGPNKSLELSPHIPDIELVTFQSLQKGIPMAQIATIIAWLGGAAFTYVYVMRVGSLRDENKTWQQALLKENDMVFFGITGIFTMVCLGLFR
jgi:hypothetical protein